MTNHHDVIAAVQAGDFKSLQILLHEDPARGSARDEAGVSAIMHALYRQCADIVDLLVATGLELDIFEAAGIGRVQRVTQLLQRDPGLVSAFSADGFTPLHFACFFSKPEIVYLLLQRGADPNAVARNSMKVTPLHSATAARHLPIVKLLLTHGGSPNVRQQAGWTPLHSAAQHGDKGLVQLLLEHGADHVARSEDGTMPAQLAHKNGHEVIAALIGMIPDSTTL